MQLKVSVMAHFSDYVTAEIKEQAARSIEHLADRYLSSEWPHKTRKGGECNYGRAKGSRSWTANLSGPRAGTVRHWSEGKSYDAIALVQTFEHCSYPEALSSLAAFLGIHVDTAPLDREQQQARRIEAERRAAQTKAGRDAEARAANTKNQRNARSFIGRSSSIEATPAEAYLTQERGLSIPADGWPASIRWHGGKSCLLCVMTNDAGEGLSGQRIFLTRDGSKRMRNGEPLPKAVLPGSTAGLAFRLPEQSTRALANTPRTPLILAEGPETALSLWQATGAETVARIGTRDITIPGARLVILARDDDKAGSPADVAADSLKASLQSAGHIVVDCWPHAERKEDKSDFNDLLKQKGEAAVLARVEAALGTLPAPLPPLDRARDELSHIVSDWLDNHYGLAPEAQPEEGPASLLIPVGVGIGKSHTAKAEAARRYMAQKQGDPETGPIVYAVPNHDLAEQNRREWQSHAPGLRVEVWKGRDQEGMCQNGEAVSVVQDAGLSVMGALCTKAKNGCPFAASCPYMAQARSKGVDVWIMAHNHLTTPPPEAIGTPGLLLIDESFAEKSLGGHEADHYRAIDSLTFPKEYEEQHPGHTGQEVRNRATRIRDVLETISKAEDCHVSAEAVSGLHFTASGMDEAIAQVNEAMSHVATEKATLERIREAAPILKVGGRMCAILREFKRVLEGGLERSGRLTAGRPKGTPSYRLTSFKKVHEGWSCPTLILDATANERSVKALFPRVQTAPAIKAAAPYAQHIWVQGLTWGKRAQHEAVKRYGSGDRTLRGHSLEGVIRTAWDRYLQTGGRDRLIICNLEMREALEGTDRMPPGTLFAHHGALVGLNDFKHVAAVDIYGRTLPKRDMFETMAEAIKGVPLAQRVKRFELVPCEIHMTAGQAVRAQAYHHPDELADGLLQEVLEGQLIQAAGRARAVMRGPENPVTIRVHGDFYPQGLPLDAVEAASLPSGVAMQLAETQGKTPALMTAVDAHSCYGDLWHGYNAAKKHIWSDFPQFSACLSNFSQSDPFTLKNILKGQRVTLGKSEGAQVSLGLQGNALYRVSFRRKGERMNWRGALLPSDWSPDDFRHWFARCLNISPYDVEMQGDPVNRTCLDVFEHELDVVAPAKGSEPAQPQSIIGGALSRAGPIPDKVGLARSLAWVYLTDALNTDPSERRAILSSEQAQRVAGRLSYRGDVTDGLAWLAGLKDEMGMEYSGSLEAMSCLRPALPEPSGNVK